jgi:hypothetical protein
MIEFARGGIPIQIPLPFSLTPPNDKSQTMNRHRDHKGLKRMNLNHQSVFAADIGHLRIIVVLDRRQSLYR